MPIISEVYVKVENKLVGPPYLEQKTWYLFPNIEGIPSDDKTLLFSVLESYEKVIQD